ncbi:MAG: amino acid ABC transporter permease [Burkholderiales bacterium]|nr:amino acid ABC transporter permease [Burkholderiales bacterium]MDE2456627.1 amino acid ABC transporter permease [Burkholderiales bacterium]
MEKILFYFFNFELVGPYLPQILQGFLLTLEMGVLTVVCGTALGLALALARCWGRRPIDLLIIFYADFFRAVPQLAIIVLIFFALPPMGVMIDPVPSTVLALSLVLGAFAEEIFWGAFCALPLGQWEAARATGMSFGSTLAYVIVPQAVRLALPQLTNRAIGITKGTSLGSVIAVPELLNVSSSIQSSIANPTALTVGALLFCTIFLPFVWLTRWVEAHYAVKR